MEREINVTVELEQERALNEILKDAVKKDGETIKEMKHIIITLIITFALTVVSGFGAFVWYESQYDTEDSKQETTVYTEGDNANAEYIEGNQYNDSTVHNEGVGK